MILTSLKLKFESISIGLPVYKDKGNNFIQVCFNGVISNK